MEPRGCEPLTDGFVLLDGYTLDDVDAHVAGEDDEQARRFGWFPKRSTPEGVRAWFLARQVDWRAGGPRLAWAARDATTLTLVGGCEVFLTGNDQARMSWWTFPPYRRRGVASRAARLAAAYAFSHLGVQCLEAVVAIDNAGSHGVARNAGFAEDGPIDSAGETFIRYLLTTG